MPVAVPVAVLIAVWHMAGLEGIKGRAYWAHGNLALFSRSHTGVGRLSPVKWCQPTDRSFEVIGITYSCVGWVQVN